MEGGEAGASEGVGVGTGADVVGGVASWCFHIFTVMSLVNAPDAMMFS